MLQQIFKTLTLIFFVLTNGIFVETKAQLSTGGEPISFNMDISISEVILAPPDIDSLQREGNNEGISGKGRYGYPTHVQFNTRNTGVWDTINNKRVWRLMLFSEGAKSLNVVFDTFWLAEGAELYLYDKEKTEVLGAFTSRNNNQNYQFMTNLIHDNTIYLELVEPLNTSHKSRLELSRVIHGVTSPLTSSEQSLKTASNVGCNMLANCSFGKEWCVEQQAVARILSPDGIYCSGVLLNNLKEDATPYFLTAFHCFNTELPPDTTLSSQEKEEAETSLFEFDHLDKNCDGDQQDTITIDFEFSGADFKAGDHKSDFLLLELSADPISGYGLHFAGWNIFGGHVNNSTQLHHPNPLEGDLMWVSRDTLGTNDTKFADFNDQKVEQSPANYLHQFWLDKGKIVDGSSGGPHFSNYTHTVSGQILGASDESCTRDWSYAGRLIKSYYNNNCQNNSDCLQPWLNPNQINTQIIGHHALPVYLINRTFTDISSNSIDHQIAALTTLEMEGNVNSMNPTLDLCPPLKKPLIVESQTEARFLGGDRVIMRQGVHLKSGSSVRIKSDTRNCDHHYVRGDVIEGICPTDATGSNKRGNFTQVSPPSPVKNEKYTKQNNRYDLKFSNHPNPFHQKTTLKYTIPKSGLVSIYITGLTGNKISTVVEHQNRNAGTYTIPFQRSRLEAGVYIAKLKFRGQTTSTKLVTIR